jgi:hypothetical protein
MLIQGLLVLLVIVNIIQMAVLIKSNRQLSVFLEWAAGEAVGHEGD